MTDTCATCGNRWGHDPAGLDRCKDMHARTERVEALAVEASTWIPAHPVAEHEACDLLAHLRAHRAGLTPEDAETAVRVALELGWRPVGQTPAQPLTTVAPAPVLVGATQPSLLDEEAFA